MKVIWAGFATVALLATGVIWLFAAGWAGAVPWLPDIKLLTTREWLGWIAIFLLLYGPPAVSLWCLVKAVRAED